MILACDLDRTLVHPLADAPADGDVVEVERYQGRPITCMSRRSIALLEEVRGTVTFVPVTTRTRAQYARLQPTVQPGRGWAICANGATVLRDGEPDAEWEAHMGVLLRDSAPLAEARDALAAAVGAGGEVPWMLRDRVADDLFLFSIVDLGLVPDDLEERARAAVAPLGWTAYLHGRKLYALPGCITKLGALEQLAGRLGEAVGVSAGDSELDRCLLDIAARAFVPAGSELAAAGDLPGHATVTSGPHVHAAEEILHAVLAAEPRGNLTADR